MSSRWTAIKEIGLEVAGLDRLAQMDLLRMEAAGAEILECNRVLKKGGANIVGELLKGQGKFLEFDHFPKGDVFDEETHSQYYYHAHRGLPGEHGHFHTFVRHRGMPADATPVAYEGKETWPSGSDALAHLIAVSMDPYGYPLGLFATNRWVTDEAWYQAQDVVRMAAQFEIDHAVPSWPTNRWLTAMMRLFRPQLAALLTHRDQVVVDWQRRHPKRDVFEDRKLEMTGWLRVSVNEQIEAVRTALGS